MTNEVTQAKLNYIKRSNDSGQPLSVYGDFQLDTAWNGLDDDFWDDLREKVEVLRAARDLQPRK